MSPNCSRSHRHVARRPACETLEGRALLSGMNVPTPLHAALVGGIDTHAIKTVPEGVAAVLAALRGGPGSEFVALVRQQIKNPAALLQRFESGATTEASIHGIAVRDATILDTFSGPHFDYQAAVAAGVVLLPRQTLELGAILRGPNRSPAPAYFVFGIDRGSGASLGPRFPARPGITPDALVTITVGPNSTNPSGTISDLKTGASAAIDPSAIQIKGSTLRVFLNTAQLPSTGLPISQYRFAFWTQSQLNGGIETVGSFLPDATMIPIGISSGGKSRP